MDFTKQVKAFNLIETLLNTGRTMTTLPISADRAKGIMNMRERATEADLRALSLATNGPGGR
jgi:hypothetical protein